MRRFLGLSNCGGFTGLGRGFSDSMQIENLTWFKNTTFERVVLGCLGTESCGISMGGGEASTGVEIG